MTYDKEAYRKVSKVCIHLVSLSLSLLQHNLACILRKIKYIKAFCNKEGNKLSVLFCRIWVIHQLIVDDTPWQP